MDRNQCLRTLRKRVDYLEQKIRDREGRSEIVSFEKEEFEAIYMAIEIIIAQREIVCPICEEHLARIGCSIMRVDDAPSNAAPWLRNYLEKNSLIIGKPICFSCKKKLIKRFGMFIHFETEAETVQKVMQDDVAMSA